VALSLKSEAWLKLPGMVGGHDSAFPGDAGLPPMARCRSCQNPQDANS